MDIQNIDLEAERQEILKRYFQLLKACRPDTKPEDQKMIRKAFDLAVEAHKDMRRKTGEPYIYHPIAVAQIAAKDIGLGTTSVICALLHDVVEDTDYTLDDISAMFGEKVARIIDGLTKISGVLDNSPSMQAENFRKMLLTLADDVRVILIKLADRLHNMRTLDAMKHEKQLKIASETLYMYAPLAHRLGLYAIKTELEDLGMKYTEPEAYNTISKKLAESEAERNKLITRFVFPIKEELEAQGIKHEMYGRVKSIHSIWSKMKRKNIPFEEVYDIFAIRIIIDTPFEHEKPDCWKVYSIITDNYKPNPDRLRDWISVPKANGYESLHTTLMGPDGRWVEVQIRSVRMEDIAEKGYAAHWKYKESAAGHNALEDWLLKIREILKNPDSNALDFLDDFKLNLFAEEIFVFTPKGDLKTLPSGATALDLAYSIHSKIGHSAIGAKVNHVLVPLNYKLKSGDQAEIITSAKQKPQEDWLSFVTTARAKTKIKDAIREEKRLKAEQGKEMLEGAFEKLEIEYTPNNIDKLVSHLNLEKRSHLYRQIAENAVSEKQIKTFFKKEERGKWYKYISRQLTKTRRINEVLNPIDKVISKVSTRPNELIIGKDVDKIDYKFSDCCTPIPGDNVFGFINEDEQIQIHRTNCPMAINLMSTHGTRIVKAKWTTPEAISFLTGIKINGVDEVGLVNRLTRLISREHGINMRSLNFEASEGLFEGTVMVYVQDTKQLEQLMKNMKDIRGIISVTRIDRN